MTNYSAHFNFSSITMSGLILSAGISKWISGQLLILGVIFFILSISLFFLISFLTTSEHKLILKQDPIFRKWVTIYYFFVVFITSSILYFFPNYYLSIFIFITPATTIVVRKMITSYEKLTGEKVE